MLAKFPAPQCNDSCYETREGISIKSSLQHKKMAGAEGHIYILHLHEEARNEGIR